MKQTEAIRSAPLPGCSFAKASERWRASSLDGFYVGHRGPGQLIVGRFDGREYELVATDGRLAYSGQGFRVSYDECDPFGSVEGSGSGEIDLTFAQIMDALRKAVLDRGAVNYVSCAVGGDEAQGDRRAVPMKGA